MQEESWFWGWRLPTEFHQRYNAVDQGIKDVDHRRNSYKWLREARVLKLFAVAMDASHLRLVKNDPPDGEVRLAGEVIPIEIVRPSRKDGNPTKSLDRGRASTFRRFHNGITSSHL